MPAAEQWFQHKLLSVLALLLGVYTLASAMSRRMRSNPYSSYAVGGALALAGVVFLFHRHINHPTMDSVNIQHRLMALTALLIAASSVLDEWDGFTWRFKAFLVPSGFIVLGLQLAFFIE